MRRITPTDGKQAQAEFICKLENIQNANEYTGLEVVSSLNITGIPSESDLKNPAIVDILIEDEEIIDYKTKSIDIPIFKPRLIDTKNSEVIGVFTKIVILSSFTYFIYFYYFFISI